MEPQIIGRHVYGNSPNPLPNKWRPLSGRNKFVRKISILKQKPISRDSRARKDRKPRKTNHRVSAKEP